MPPPIRQCTAHATLHLCIPCLVGEGFSSNPHISVWVPSSASLRDPVARCSSDSSYCLRPVSELTASTVSDTPSENGAVEKIVPWFKPLFRQTWDVTNFLPSVKVCMCVGTTIYVWCKGGLWLYMTLAFRLAGLKSSEHLPASRSGDLNIHGCKASRTHAWRFSISGLFSVLESGDPHAVGTKTGETKTSILIL
ncbi:predicted protein [Plenodomus lingam JN3]|uniref:Predicted protein n=1 Tax=Leptosphaeria maculans (strain JN3 / isolate v23.1.3 / race Av1-4-5-6-7-8) TaxID=985895 RepID=E5ACP6_LEPMJ|nr:predicted protein [Plenodomus lingam JN3]CBY02248.1 predicted protein [Plenodomus lingam JN3]